MAAFTVTLSDGSTTVTFTNSISSFSRQMTKTLRIHERSGGNIKSKDINKRTQTFKLQGEWMTVETPKTERDNLYILADSKDTEKTLTLVNSDHADSSWTVRPVDVFTDDLGGAGGNVKYNITLVEVD